MCTKTIGIAIVREYVFLRFFENAKNATFLRFYRAMHFSAKRGIAIACRLSVRLSVCLSVCNVGEL